MPHAPISSSTPPNEVTASTIVSASCLRAIAASSRTGLQTPVEVSPWTIATTSAGVAASDLSSIDGSAALPHSPLTRVTVAPYRSHICARRSPKYPVATTVARDPGRTMFATAVSMPDVPVPETANAKEPSGARNNRVSFARTSSSIATISGSRWPTVGAAIARMTRGDVMDGPGPSRIRSDSGRRVFISAVFYVVVVIVVWDRRHATGKPEVALRQCGGFHYEAGSAVGALVVSAELRRIERNSFGVAILADST